MKISWKIVGTWKIIRYTWNFVTTVVRYRRSRSLVCYTFQISNWNILFNIFCVIYKNCVWLLKFPMNTWPKFLNVNAFSALMQRFLNRWMIFFAEDTIIVNNRSKKSNLSKLSMVTNFLKLNNFSIYFQPSFLNCWDLYLCFIENAMILNSTSIISPVKQLLNNSRMYFSLEKLLRIIPFPTQRKEHIILNSLRKKSYRFQGGY